MKKYIEEILVRDLNQLKTELQGFRQDADLWKIQGEIKNPAGVLSQHLCGNLKHFIGATLGNTGYMRNRDLEFTQTGLSREILLRNVEETIEVIKNTLRSFPESRLSEKYPIPFAGREVNTTELLLIITTHFSYHLGQVNYLRRALA